MPVSNKKHTTPQQSPVQPPQPLPAQAEFYQHLREQARVGLRALLEGVMQEELQALLAAEWGEHTPNVKAIATASTRGIWAPLRASSRIC